MKEIAIKKYIRYLFWLAFVVFILNKFYLRPWITKHETDGILLIITYSIPNLIEAVIGTIVVTGILSQARQYFDKKLGALKTVHVHILAVLLSSIYVLSQELKIHNLGGNNVYDPNDMIASMIGLVGTFALIRRYGFTD